MTKDNSGVDNPRVVKADLVDRMLYALKK